MHLNLPTRCLMIILETEWQVFWNLPHIYQYSMSTRVDRTVSIHPLNLNLSNVDLGANYYGSTLQYCNFFHLFSNQVFDLLPSSIVISLTDFPHLKIEWQVDSILDHSPHHFFSCFQKCRNFSTSDTCLFVIMNFDRNGIVFVMIKEFNLLVEMKTNGMKFAKHCNSDLCDYIYICQCVFVYVCVKKDKQRDWHK